MARELPKVYEPQQVESKIYDMWQQGGYFHAEVDESKKPFTIVMPCIRLNRIRVSCKVASMA